VNDHTDGVPTFGFLHTSPVHVATFEALVAEIAPGATAVSVVDESLLERARAEGPDAALVEDGIERALDALERSRADVVVCTCSTIGGTAERIGGERGVDVTRVDRPMVERALATGQRIGVVAAVESTIAPTLSLIDSIAGDLGRRPHVTVHLLPGAWALFEDGDIDGYLDAIARELPQIADTCDVVVLAQASMAAVTDRVEVSVAVLSSPRLAIEAAVAAADSAVSSSRRDRRV